MMKTTIYRVLGAAVISTSLTACGMTAIRTNQAQLPRRAIFVEQDGEAIPVIAGDAKAKAGVSWEQQYEQQLHEMMDDLRMHPAPQGVMIIVHGGLTPLQGSRKESEVLGEAISRDGYNPIFINWRSDFKDSYLEHLTRVRQGQAVHPVKGVPGIPLYLLADLGRGITRWPLTAAAQVWDGTRRYQMNASNPEMAEYIALRRDFGKPGQVQVSLGAYCRTGRDHASTIYKFPFFPARLVMAPISDALGTSAWDNMGRRTTNLFRQPVESAVRTTAYGDQFRSGQGAAAMLMDSLAGLLQEDAALGRPKRPITLIGHSMGTIVLNELIGAYPTLEYNDIVYMAAASSIRQFHDKVLPYLVSHPNARFYNLTLHPSAEAREQNFQLGLPLAPGGSLLEYIDDYYAKPLTHIDRTLGKWTNVIETTHLIPPSVRDRVTIKAFGVNDPRDVVGGKQLRRPRKHGQFNDENMRFWHREFWEAVPLAPGAQVPDNLCTPADGAVP